MRQPIREVQGYLRLIASRYPSVAELQPDGIFGSLTTEAVREFQKQFALPITGVVDFDTWDTIYRVYLPIAAERNSANHIGQPFPSEEGVIRLGDSGLAVELLHAHMNQLGRQYRNITVVSDNSSFGEETRRNILEIQRVSRLPQTGEVDAATWNILLGISGMTES